MISAQQADQHPARDDEQRAQREPPPDPLGPPEEAAPRAPTPQSDSVATSGATTLRRPRKNAS